MAVAYTLYYGYTGQPLHYDYTVLPKAVIVVTIFSCLHTHMHTEYIIDGTRYAAICYLYDAARACSAWLSCRVETCSDEPLCTLSEHEWSELQAEIRLSSAALAAICAQYR